METIFARVRLLDCKEAAAQKVIDEHCREKAVKRETTLASLGDTQATASFLQTTMQVSRHLPTDVRSGLFAQVLKENGGSQKRQRRAASSSLKIYKNSQAAGLASAKLEVKDDDDSADDE